MKRTIPVLLLVLIVLPLNAAVRHTADLGWTAGQDISTEFAGYLSTTFTAGDELILDHTYRISGTHQLPDDCIISGVKGSGFDVTDAVSDQNRSFLKMGSRCTLRNLAITYLNCPEPTPDAGTSPQRGVDFYPMIGITVSGKDDVSIEYCKLYGAINHQLKVSSSARLKVIGCHITGGYWSTYLSGDVTDALFKYCLIEKCQGDGIKTGRGGSFGVKRPRVESCVFQDCGRDAIDTTGGFLDAVVIHCVMRRLFSGMDIKSYFESTDHLSLDCLNTNILVDSCTFTDMANCITLSTLDRGLEYNDSVYFLDSASAQIYAPHDIDIDDCIFEKTGSSGVRMLLLKGGHTVRYKNAMFRGDGVSTVKYTNVYETFGPASLSEEVSLALNHSVTGTKGPTGPAGAPGDTSIAFTCGPQDELSIADEALPANTHLLKVAPGILYDLQGSRVYGQGRMPAGIYLKEQCGALVKTIVH